MQGKCEPWQAPGSSGGIFRVILVGTAPRAPKGEANEHKRRPARPLQRLDPQPGATVRFYEDVLGLVNGRDHRSTSPALGSTAMGIRCCISTTFRSRIRRNVRPGVIDHAAFGSRGFKEMKQRLAVKGVQFRVNNVPNSTRRQIFVTDPNNVDRAQLRHRERAGGSSIQHCCRAVGCWREWPEGGCGIGSVASMGRRMTKRRAGAKT